MGYTLDYFVAALLCPVCGAISAPDSSTIAVCRYVIHSCQNEILQQQSFQPQAVKHQTANRSNMQMRLRNEPQLAYLGVGDLLEFDIDRVEDSGYLAIRQPLPGEAIRFLQTWECPTCGSPYNWAQITIGDGMIRGIEAIPLNREVFEQAHFISDEVSSTAADLTGLSFAELVGADLVQILRERL